jgi:Ca2+-transporting ATPase
MSSNNFNQSGLTSEQVLQARAKHGDNQLNYKKENGFLDALKSIDQRTNGHFIARCLSHLFYQWKKGDGIFLASAIVLVSGYFPISRFEKP